MGEDLLTGLCEQKVGNFLECVQETDFLDGDDSLCGQGLKQVAVILAKGSDGRAFQIQYTFKPSTRPDQRHGQLRTHFQTGIQGIID